MKLTKPRDRFSTAFGKEFDLCTFGIPHYDYFHKKLIQILKEKYKGKKPIKILEIGAGTGNVLHRLRESELIFQYVGVESSPVMYNQLVRKFNDIPNATFVLKDGLAFLEENTTNTFSVVINSWTFHNWNCQYRKEAIRGVFYNLDTNGIFLNADKIAIDCSDTHKKNYSWQIEYIKNVFSTRPDIVNEWIQHYQVDEQDDILLNENTFSTTLKHIGFSNYELIERKFMDVVSVAYK